MNPLKVLLIDDDTIEIMKLNRTVLSLELDHDIVDAKNGEQALKILEQKDEIPDIILLDLNMPKINGIEFLSILKESDELKHIPTITSIKLKKCWSIGVLTN